MKSVESVCKELKSLDGVVGAFVLQKSRCIASSLPPQYDFGRLGQVAEVLARVSQISQKAGYADCAMAFHWQRASLMSWPLGDDTVLGLLATPNAVRESVNMSAALAIEDLSGIVQNDFTGGSGAPSLAREVTGSAPASPGKAVQDNPELGERLREIERLLMEELGPSGKSLLERCRNKTPRGKASPSEWLLALRQAVIGDIADPGARVTVGSSHHWAGLD